MYDLPVSLAVRHTKTLNAQFLDGLTYCGIKHIDFDLCEVVAESLEKQYQSYTFLETGLKNLAYKGITPTDCHINFGTFWDLSAFNDDERTASLKRTVEMIERLKTTGIKNFVVHGNGWDYSKDRERGEGLQKLKKSLLTLSEIKDTNVALENLPRNCLGNTSEEMLELIGGTNIKIVLDTNHFLQEKTEDAVLKLGKYIIALHVSDYDGIDEKHWLPGAGVNDWNKIIENLQKIGYAGTFNYETSVPPEEVVKNKETLFSNYNKYKYGT